MENEIYRYFDESRRLERKQTMRSWILNRLVEAAAMAIIVFAIVMILLTIGGTPWRQNF